MRKRVKSHVTYRREVVDQENDEEKLRLKFQILFLGLRIISLVPLRGLRVSNHGGPALVASMQLRAFHVCLQVVLNLDFDRASISCKHVAFSIRPCRPSEINMVRSDAQNQLARLVALFREHAEK